MKLCFTVVHAHPIYRVYDPYNCVGLLEIIAPIRSEGSLTAYVPCKCMSHFHTVAKVR